MSDDIFELPAHISRVTSPPLLAIHPGNHIQIVGITKLIGERVTGLSIEDRCRIVSTASGTAIRGRTVILASGAEKRKLDIPGEKALAAYVKDPVPSTLLVLTGEKFDGRKAWLAAAKKALNQIIDTGKSPPGVLFEAEAVLGELP